MKKIIEVIPNYKIWDYMCLRIAEECNFKYPEVGLKNHYLVQRDILFKIDFINFYADMVKTKIYEEIK
jgi:hypothetical protein